MQAAGDSFLGWVTGQGSDGDRREYYVRQLWDEKGSALVDLMNPHEMDAYAKVCGSTLAHAHARSGDRIAIAAYLGSSPTFDHAVVEFAEEYAELNEHDYQALRTAVDDGRVAAEEGI